MSMLAGLDCLIAGGAAQLKGKRVGLATHPAAVTRDLADSVTALRRCGVTLTALFGPEHGFSGAVADGQQVQDTVYRDTQLPIYSLYGT
ncbi:MAG: exo-beta-N-acetylmuramidase NamZ domain-containing protein, partial [Anaerolineae bacterium]